LLAEEEFGFAEMLNEEVFEGLASALRFFFVESEQGFG
jgi:hypothetical protein